jgi:sterol desaturase/sphingolipid hydroxylase (fatty acid hydroxylase superfamily)
MTEILLANETVVRLIFFVAVFSLMATWEVAAPQRKRSSSRRLRWSNNLAIVIINTVLLRVLIPIAAVELALLTQTRGWGLFNFVTVPAPLVFIFSIMLLDLAIYLQHFIFHVVPVFWRLHRMHHADLDFDVTTGIRFHPLEILLSMGLKLAVVAVLGPSAIAVLIFEILLNGTAMFNHSNIRMPPRLDGFLRWFIVTPDMHRVHHSVLPDETNSNFGVNLPWWDRLFGTYTEQPADGHLDMTIGIEEYRTSRDLYIDRLLTQPFRSGGKNLPIGLQKK